MAKVPEQLNLLLEEMSTWENPDYVIASLTHLVDIHPELLEHSFTFEVLGRAYGLQDNKPLAAEIFEYALKLDPTRAQASAWYNQVRECEDVNYDEEKRTQVSNCPTPCAYCRWQCAVTDAETWRNVNAAQQLLRQCSRSTFTAKPPVAPRP